MSSRTWYLPTKMLVASSYRCGSDVEKKDSFGLVPLRGWKQSSPFTSTSLIYFLTAHNEILRALSCILISRSVSSFDTIPVFVRICLSVTGTDAWHQAASAETPSTTLRGSSFPSSAPATGAQGCFSRQRSTGEGQGRTTRRGCIRIRVSNYAPYGLRLWNERWRCHIGRNGRILASRGVRPSLQCFRSHGCLWLVSGFLFMRETFSRLFNKY